MQLLDSEQLEFAFQLHGIALEEQARRFYGDLWQVIQDAERAPDIAAINQKSKTVRTLFHDYFDLVADWRERLQGDEAPDSVGRDLMYESRELLAPFEKQFCRYAICYMELNRALIRNRAHISFFSKDKTFEDDGKDLEVKHATGTMLDRAHAELSALVEKRRRLERMKLLLKSSDSFMEDLGSALPSVMGPEGDHQLTLFKGALRRSEFDHAQKLVRKWPTDSLRANGQYLASLFLQKKTDLQVQDGLVLHSGELSLPLTILQSDERKLRAFLDKHNLPYMLFRYRNLIHLGYLLGRIGSIEGLIIHHAKLSSLAVRPRMDEDEVRRARQTVLQPVKALLTGQFPTLGPIFNEMEVTQAALDRLFSQTRDYMASHSG